MGQVGNLEYCLKWIVNVKRGRMVKVSYSS